MSRVWSALSFLTRGLLRTRGDSTGAFIYLSFDDGPHPLHTPELLRLLAQHNAKGSFFLQGNKAQQEPDVVRRLLAEGHAIGNHSMTHPSMKYLDARNQWAEIVNADLALQLFDGCPKHMYRPPNGRLTITTLVACILRRQPLVLWAIDSLDYKLSPPEVVARLQARRPLGGDVILFHDDAAGAAKALEILLPQWKEMGFTFPRLK